MEKIPRNMIGGSTDSIIMDPSGPNMAYGYI